MAKTQTPGYKSSKDDLLKRLARVEGQVRGVSGMVEDDRYCIDVLTQIEAAQAALNKIALGLVDEIDLHIAPVLLGQGIRLYDSPGSTPVRLHRLGEGDSTEVMNVRYRPAAIARPA